MKRTLIFSMFLFSFITIGTGAEELLQDRIRDRTHSKEEAIFDRIRDRTHNQEYLSFDRIGDRT
jgi:hypothetical protein